MAWTSEQALVAVVGGSTGAGTASDTLVEIQLDWPPPEALGGNALKISLVGTLSAQATIYLLSAICVEIYKMYSEVLLAFERWRL